MHTTARLLAPGLARRSLDEAKRFVKLGMYTCFASGLLANT